MAQQNAPHNIITDRQVITLKEARKLLGIDGKTLSDSQVEQLVDTLTSAANEYLHDIGSINYNG